MTGQVAKLHLTKIKNLEANSSESYKKVKEEFKGCSSADLREMKIKDKENAKSITVFQHAKKTEKVLNDSKNSLHDLCEYLIDQNEESKKDISLMKNQMTLMKNQMTLMSDQMNSLYLLNKFMNLRNNFEYFLMFFFDLDIKDRIENITNSLEKFMLSLSEHFSFNCKKPKGIVIENIIIDAENLPGIRLHQHINPKAININKFRKLIKYLLSVIANADYLKKILDYASTQYHGISNSYVHTQTLTKMAEIKFENSKEKTEYEFLTILTLFCESETAINQIK